VQGLSSGKFGGLVWLKFGSSSKTTAVKRRCVVTHCHGAWSKFCIKVFGVFLWTASLIFFRNSTKIAEFSVCLQWQTGVHHKLVCTTNWCAPQTGVHHKMVCTTNWCAPRTGVHQKMVLYQKLVINHKWCCTTELCCTTNWRCTTNNFSNQTPTNKEIT